LIFLEPPPSFFSFFLFFTCTVEACHTLSPSLSLLLRRTHVVRYAENKAEWELLDATIKWLY
jgi:hypothetical protein